MTGKSEKKFVFGALIFIVVCAYLIFKILFQPLVLDKVPTVNGILEVKFSPNPFYKKTLSRWHSIDEQYYEANVKGVEFRIFVELTNNDRKWRVIAIQTCDPKFVSADGFSPGVQTMEDIANRLGVDGDGMSIELSDGWYVVNSEEAEKIMQCFNKYEVNRSEG